MYPEMTKRWFCWLPLLLFAIYLLALGVRPLVMPDETRYAEISREMITSGDWVTPRLLGLRYFEKPVLDYWLNGLSQLLFSHTHFAVRFASALSAGLSALLVGLLATRISANHQTGYAAAAIYLSFVLVFTIGIFSVLDSMLTLFLCAAMMAFYDALQASNDHQRLLRYVLFGGCCVGSSYRLCSFPSLKAN